MNSVTAHYDSHLGPVYSWMVGDLEAAFRRSDAELDELELPAVAAGRAVDLGAGFGLHALPLARRGFSVVAVDACDTLLKELAALTGTLPVRGVNADLLEFDEHIDAPVDVALCMGDTLTHLPMRSSVEALFDTVAANLVDGGVFVATFRDYVTAPLQGDSRFILVRQDECRILTCFLDYAEETVTVHDLLHEREGAQWRLRVSSYPKLRLAPDWVAAALRARGFTVHRETADGGMVRITARRTGEPSAAD